jgi:tripartite-type tricarboxylate transporter receptor subunit TctC
MQTRRQFLTSAVALAAAGPATPAFAQSWPQRPVKVVVAFAPGGNSDSIARIACQRLGDAFGQTFVIENRPGAGGALGAEAVARAAPDGYTLFSAATPQIAITPALQKVPYDPIKDFAPISNVGSNPFVLSVNAKLPIKSVAEFIAYVRARPGGQVTFGSGGVGTLNHLSMTMFAKLAGIDITHVPYKGGGPAMADLVAGHIQAMFANLSDALGQAGAGTIRLLAVSSEKRAAAPRCSDRDRAGLPELQDHDLERVDGAGRHAKGDRRADRRRGRPRVEGTEIHRADDADRSRCHRRHAGGVRRHHRGRRRVLGRGGEGGGSGPLRRC